MKRFLAAAMSVLPISVLADCGDERRDYMALDNTSAAGALIACLEGELAKARQTASAASGGEAESNCPSFPVIPVSPKTPGNPMGAEQEIYAFLNYYRSLTDLDAENWMVGAASALDTEDSTALVTGRTGTSFCANGLATYDFDWDAGQYLDAENDFGILIYPELKGAFGGQ
jgi:hypothetical protein